MARFPVAVGAALIWHTSPLRASKRTRTAFALAGRPFDNALRGKLAPRLHGPIHLLLVATRDRSAQSIAPMP